MDDVSREMLGWRSREVLLEVLEGEPPFIEGVVETPFEVVFELEGVSDIQDWQEVYVDHS